MYSLVDSQWEFLKDLARLIAYAESHPNIRLTGGDLWANTGHMSRSLHYDRLAIDLNLHVKEAVEGEDQSFKWTYVPVSHPFWECLGDKWLSLSPQNRWGGNFPTKDYGHFSRAVDNRA